MVHRLLIDSDPFETRVAVLEDERLVEVFVERHLERASVGNIYKGRVTRVLAGMQAAFVDIGLERDAFLYVRDAQPAPADADRAPESGESARREGDADGAAAALPIQELVAEGDEILVQVVKDPLPRKGARVSTQIALPARFLVLLPRSARSAVSRRIEEPEERQRLLEAVAELGAQAVIVRTAGEGRSAGELVADHAYLLGLWDEVEQRAGELAAPSLVHTELEPALRVVRDLVDESYEEILVEGAQTFRAVATFLDRVQPALAGRVRQHTDEVPLFEGQGLEQQLDAALRSKVWLKSGGYLIINPTEALVAIDVNTGRFVGGTSLEDTVFKTNLEAVRELVRQVRLRDLGGIIVVDLIDMELPENRAAVLEALQKEFAKDRARSKVLGLSDFGLVEITRKRSRANLRGVLTEPCPECHGDGRVKSAGTLLLAIRREILRAPGRFGGRDPLVLVHPAVEQALGPTERRVLADVERTLGKKVVVRADPSLHREQYELLTV